MYLQSTGYDQGGAAWGGRMAARGVAEGGEGQGVFIP